jgi:hypothetical protein
MNSQLTEESASSIFSVLPPFAALRRLASNLPLFADADVFDFVILYALSVDDRAAFTDGNGPIPSLDGMIRCPLTCSDQPPLLPISGRLSPSPRCLALLVSGQTTPIRFHPWLNCLFF